MNVNERIQALRKLMEERNIDVYYVPNEDDHLSEEYTAAYYHCKSWLSGFTGEAGCTIVTKDFAGLWTDGRYFTQAEGELEGTCVELMRLRQPGVMDPLEFLIHHTPENGVLGFDGRVVSASDAEYLQDALKKKNAVLHIHEDLVDQIWTDRPAMPMEKLFVLDKQWVGESASERISRTVAKMKEADADVLILTALEDPCWVFNIRGNDIPCTPAAYAYAVLTEDESVYYVNLNDLTPEVQQHFHDNHIQVKAYEDISADLKALHGEKILTDLRKLNSSLYTAIPEDNTVINEKSPVEMFRAVKNDTEIRMMHKAQEKDGAAMVRFLKWVKENVGKGDMTELSAQNKLYELRAQGEDYIEPSFTTICAYQENGAMMHYTAVEDNYAKVEPKGFLLVDSGGTYKDGTTDITRTIAAGPLTDEEKKLYTLVLKGHIDLANAVFLHGTAGNNLDILARNPLWQLHIDYQCGTGHGVGHVLGVHEGPHGIRWGMPTAARPSAILEEGMIVTDEPGVYLPHKVGIRIENDLLVVKDTENFYGTFLKFEHMTYCPYDLDAIDVQYLDDEEIRSINAYHQMVFTRLSPYLNEEETAWLKTAVRELKK